MFGKIVIVRIVFPFFNEFVVISYSNRNKVEAGRTQYYNIADPRDPVVEEPSDQWFPSKKIQPPSASSTSKGQKRKNRKKH